MKILTFTTLAVIVGQMACPAGPRVANDTITMPATPPVTSIEIENAFPGVSFSQPLCLRSPDGDTQRLFVCEKGGDLELVPDVTAATPTKVTFLDLDQVLSARGEAIQTTSEMGLLSVAFHPDYATNGYFFTVYNVSLAGGDFQRLSRWHDPDITDTAADPNSEEVLIEMFDDRGNHNGGDLHFGPDGYLYMSWGDEGAANDTRDNSQFLDKDYWAAITRIDVDLEPEDYTVADGTGSDDANVRPNSHPAVQLYGAGADPLYEVPADNPWVGATSFNGVAVVPTEVRNEFFAVGFRNPWRFSFDSVTGELWVGDVGQGAWEEVAVVQSGENHGWAWYEGDANGAKFNQTINGASRTDATNLTFPAWDYARGNGPFQGQSVTGGVVYRGARFPSLQGKYIFGDYASGNIWALERTATPGEPDVERIAGEGGIAGFGTDPSNGDVLMADLGNGVVRRLVVEDNPGGTFPASLTATGIFSDVVTLTPNPGVVAYDVNLPFWSDHALKRRWFAIKNTVDQFGYAENGAWSTPAGSVFVKHFDLELERGDPATQKRIETRVLVRNRTGQTTDTTLVAAGVSARVLVPADGSLGATWVDAGFDDSAWGTAATGIGYDTNTDYNDEFGAGGDLDDTLDGVNTSVYVRIPFQVPDAASVDELTLRMKYDDGFVAFLNGVQVASANPPSTPLAWDSEASGQHADSAAQTFVDFDITAAAPGLVNGTNVLAIQGLNDGIGSSDMLVLPELVAGVFTSFVEGSYGVSYRWNEAGTEAFLVGDGGEEIDLTIETPTGQQTQTWTIPSRAACIVCHNAEAGHTLSFNSRQLNRDGAIGTSTGNFLNVLLDCEYLDDLPEQPSAIARHVTPDETQYSLEARVRSYLDVNCAYCHQDPGTAPPSWLANHHLTLGETGMIGGVAASGTQNPADRIVVPGDTDRSILLSRVAGTGGYARMPALATNELDASAIQLLTDWIDQEATALADYTAWRVFHFGDDTSASGARGIDADGDLRTNEDEWLALTDPRDDTDYAEVSSAFTGGSIAIDLPGTPNRRVTVERSTNLTDWSLWDVPGNDGIPRNPSTGGILSGTAAGDEEFFRLVFEE